jgi:hypothetical protein
VIWSETLDGVECCVDGDDGYWTLCCDDLDTRRRTVLAMSHEASGTPSYRCPRGWPEPQGMVGYETILLQAKEAQVGNKVRLERFQAEQTGLRAKIGFKERLVL